MLRGSPADEIGNHLLIDCSTFMNYRITPFSTSSVRAPPPVSVPTVLLENLVGWCLSNSTLLGLYKLG